MRRPGLALIVGGGLLWAPPAGAEVKPFVWTGIGPKSVTVGQPVTLTVDVYVPTWFTSAPLFPQIEVKDAVVVFLEEGGENMSQTVGEQTYAGQRRQYLIYPQRAGDFVVAPFEVQVRYAIDAKPAPRTPVTSQGGKFAATIPQAAAGLDHFIATSAFRITSVTDPPPTDLKVGDSLTRTITLTADNAFAMMLPPLAFPPIEGLAVYPGSPRLSDSGGERGELRVGKRVESATYALQKEGSYLLPPIEIAWWDTGAHLLRRSQAPAVEFSVAPNPGLKAEIPLPPDPTEQPATPPPFDWRRFLRKHGPRAFAILLALGLLYRLLQDRLRSLHSRFAARRRRREESAAAYLRKIEDVARSGTPAQVLTATYRWLDHRESSGSAARLDRFAEESGDPELPRLADSFVDSVLADERRPGDSSPGRFASALVRADRRLHPKHADHALGPLNPERVER